MNRALRMVRTLRMLRTLQTPGTIGPSGPSRPVASAAPLRSWRRQRRLGAASLLILALATLGLLGAGTPAWAKEVPYLSGRIVDQANMIPQDVEERLDTELADFEKQTGSQVAVLTVDSLDGEALEDYSIRVAQTWGLGRKGVDDGVLLLIAKQDRKLRIEVGYGLEDELTDLEAGRIIRNVITPKFKQGDFAGGIEQGVGAILGTLRDEPGAIPDEPPPSANTGPPFKSIWQKGLFAVVFLSVMGVFATIALFGKGCQSWFLYLFLMPFFATFPAAFIGSKYGAGLVVFWIVLFPLFKLFFSRTTRGRRLMKSSPLLHSMSTWVATSSRGGGGGGFSGGGFSGGGGSFGGGGASGSW